MKAAFHYLVKVKLLRLKSPGKIEFIEYEDKFEDEKPITARREAFLCYQSFLDTLLSAKGVIYEADERARIALSSVEDIANVRLGSRDIDLSNAFGLGLAVFMVIDKPSDEYIVEDHAADELLIHGIGGLGWATDPKSAMTALAHEYWYYERYRMDMGDAKCSVSFYEYDIAQAESNIILATPFDWTGFNKPYSEKYHENQFSSREHLILSEFIKNGECSQIEFKPTLLFNHKTGKGGISIKGIIAKTICAMLNSNGGILFIGISNKSEIQGLQYDYSLAGTKKPRDFFHLEFDQMIEHFLTLSVKSNLSGQFFQIEGKDLYVVTILPSKHRPVFLNGQEGKEFYVRTDISSRHISDIEEIANYCIDTWTN